MRKNKRLIAFRESIDKTQEEMARILGVSNSYYSKIELGERNPSYNFLTKFKSKFNTNINDIFFEMTKHVECDAKTA
jgi:putative transcriptional regulator